MSNVSNENNLTQYVIVVDDQRLLVIHNVELRHNRYHKTYFTSEVEPNLQQALLDAR